MHNRFNLQKRKTDHGFTLVELLVVIIIIGILAAVAVPAFLNQRQKANEAALKSDMKSLALNYEEWGVGHLNIDYPDVYLNWPVGGTSNSEAATFSYKTSAGTLIHSFDIRRYYPTKGYKAGEAFCIEGVNTGGKNQQMFYNSVTGGFTKVDCALTPNAS